MQEGRTTHDGIDGRYGIVRSLGQGGSGITYATEVLEIGQLVAVKELSLLSRPAAYPALDPPRRLSGKRRTSK